MSESNIRAIQILSLIPTEPNYITTKDIQSKLENESPDFKVSLRTIQRDISQLSSSLSIIQYKKGWCFTKNTKVFQLPSMNFEAALGFKLIDKFLEKMLPPAIINFLHLYVAKAEEILDSSNDKLAYKEWTDKIEVINTNPLINPEIDSKTVNIIYEAIFKKKKLHVLEYQKRNLEIDSFETDPLGLVFRDNNIYLVGTSTKYDHVVNRPLHRIKKAVILDQKAEIPKDFILKNSLKSFDWLLSDKKFKFKAEVNKVVSNQFYEKKISEDQKITKCENGNIIVEATIEDSNNLRFFLFTLADNIKIIEPKKLLDEFKNIAKNLGKLYL